MSYPLIRQDIYAQKTVQAYQLHPKILLWSDW